MRHYRLPKLKHRGTFVWPALHCALWSGAPVEQALAHSRPPAEESEGEIKTLDTIEVEGRATDLLGVAGSASQGVVGQPEFKFRPLARVGELVEVVPGALATQHSGSGKANQYFLRGFNLDHGTDFSVLVDGVPMNMPTHAHGQGYLDLNSIIPELVDKVEYGKGPYYADVGDFSSAGYARMHTLHTLSQGLLKFTGGEFGYYRTVLANSHKIGPGELLYGGEVHFYDGVWKQPEDLDKYNGMLRYTVDEEDWGVSVNGKAYHSNWTATNQIPDRAIRDRSLDLYGSLDPSDGGNSNRYSLASNFWKRGDAYKSDFNVYAVYTDLALYSNFSGYIDPAGDQIKQQERRVVVGGNGELTHYDRWFGFDMDNTVGLQVRHDEVMGLALNHTQARETLQNIRRDDVGETSLGLYIKNQTHWLEKFRTITGLRSDFVDFDVKSPSDGRNSGDKGAALISPKLSFVIGPWYDTEYFLNLGYGYHSNDARGTVQRIDPNSGDAVSPVNPLVWSRGGEIGLRSQAVPGLNTTLALWWLQMNSELVFVGDAGTTEPTGRSERYGVEWTNYYQPTDWLTLDADLAFTSSGYTHVARNANNIPNSVGRVISAGAVIDLPQGYFFTARVRHFGQVALTEGNTGWAGDTTLVSFGGGYRYKDYKVELDLFNAFDSRASDIAYYYNACTRTETCPRAGDEPGNPGLLRHPVEPRMVRVTASLSF
ncbi:TonB-dependent receptor [Methylococcus sp. EFPC2]|uniref:TonB-dependent receptor n=1 Tax=Methylococcus sp. EFPC2 TaxID=2812648 RepID=UPI001967C13D|nr:TonB-dependent receptor [Methylococcus sp. EFPC2]QSA97719.1 TonB-dependent receptor plug domain-containing protein [Methylococcus sp. EFPC2]